MPGAGVRRAQRALRSRSWRTRRVTEVLRPFPLSARRRRSTPPNTSSGARRPRSRRRRRRPEATSTPPSCLRPATFQSPRRCAPKSRPSTTNTDAESRAARIEVMRYCTTCSTASSRGAIDPEAARELLQGLAETPLGEWVLPDGKRNEPLTTTELYWFWKRYARRRRDRRRCSGASPASFPRLALAHGQGKSARRGTPARTPAGHHIQSLRPSRPTQP